MHESTVDRFWAKVNKLGPVHPTLGTRCWVWKAAKDKDGYGFFKYEGQMCRAHRLAFKLQSGRWPAPSAIHLCDNPSCVRYEHLHEGTIAENNADRQAKGRSAVGARNGGGAKLTDEAVRQIRKLHAEEGWSCSRLAAHYGVHKSRISRVITRKNWKHVT